MDALRGRTFSCRSAVKDAVYGILGRCAGHTDWSADQIIEWMLARGILRRFTGFRIPTRL